MEKGAGRRTVNSLLQSADSSLHEAAITTNSAFNARLTMIADQQPSTFETAQARNDKSAMTNLEVLVEQHGDGLRLAVHQRERRHRALRKLDRGELSGGS
jgi:hypothetical protein